MRKSILVGLLAATLAPGIAQAQDRELRDDRRDVREQRQDLRDAQHHGSYRDVRRERHDLRDARQEYREDWRDWRSSHPDVYRGPAWVGPRGGGYRPVDVGYRFRPEFYDRRYWVDPARYHLRPIAGPHRWVRYGRDVLLVDTRSGRVIEVNRGFFY